MAPMDPDIRQQPHSQHPATRVGTIPAVGLCQVSGEWGGMYSRIFFLFLTLYTGYLFDSIPAVLVN